MVRAAVAVTRDGEPVSPTGRDLRRIATAPLCTMVHNRYRPRELSPVDRGSRLGPLLCYQHFVACLRFARTRFPVAASDPIVSDHFLIHSGWPVCGCNGRLRELDGQMRKARMPAFRPQGRFAMVTWPTLARQGGHFPGQSFGGACPGPE